MNITVFGANGKTGRHVVEQALGQGHEVAAFVYDAELERVDESLTQIVGDVTRLGDVRRAVGGSDAVISVLGHSPKTLKRNPSMHQDGIANIITAMNEFSVKRLISLTGSGVRCAGDRPGLLDRVLNFGLSMVAARMIADGRAHAELIRQSELDWTIVRALKLMNGPKTGLYAVNDSVQPRMKSTVNRADVADFILHNLQEYTYINKMPVIYKE